MQITPSRTIAIGNKEYVLDGSFETLGAIQNALCKDIVQIRTDVADMRFDELVRLIAMGCRGDAIEIGQAIQDEIGIVTREYVILKTEVMTWLHVALAPKADREKKSQEMQAVIDKQKELASLGQNISASLSESSGGSQASSGVAMSGN